MLVVSDPGIVAAGHVQKGIDSLVAAGLQTHLFDGAQENPTTENIEQGLAVAKEFKPNLLVGLGGGSSMDCAKGSTLFTPAAAPCTTTTASAKQKVKCCQ